MADILEAEIVKDYNPQIQINIPTVDTTANYAGTFGSSKATEAELVENFDQQRNLRTIPLRIKAAVAAAPNMESKIATLQKFYPNGVEQDRTDPNNFYVINEDNEKLILTDKNKFDISYGLDWIRPVSAAVVGTAGAVIGGAAGLVSPVPGGAAYGAVAGAGLGTAAGTQIAELIGKTLGTEILRTPSELVEETAMDIAYGGTGQVLGPAIVQGAKYALRGGKQATEVMVKRLQDFANAGVAPSLGQATERRAIHTVEMALSNIPGGGLLSEFAQKAQDDLGKRATRIAADLIGKETPATTIEAGRKISMGISADGIGAQNSFLGRFKSRAGLLYGEVDKFIKPQSNVKLTNTLTELKNQVSPIVGAEKTSEIFKNKFLNEVFENIQMDIAKQTYGAEQLPYNAVKQIRSKIGNKLADFPLVSDVDKGSLKLVYKAISDDLLSFTKSQGSKAANTYNRANNYYRSGLDRIENYLEPIQRVADPDKLTSILLSSSKEGATRINAIKKSLTDEQYKFFLSSVVDRLGKIRPSMGMATEASGEVVTGIGQFSSETFLTNWNSLNKIAKDVLFSGKGLANIRSDLNTIAKVSSIIRESGKTFKNPSGSADRLIGQTMLLGGAASVAMGNPKILVTLPLIIGGANISSKLLTNAKFINWVARGVDIADAKGIDGVIQHIGRLGTVMANADSESRHFINNYLNMTQNAEMKRIKQKQRQRQ